ncbi:MAG TPA: hypothetical protein VHY84_15000 [Bryobacteraceae bacterium]|nr:hypothetical protein [Bryobacteraceae bacterium]
MGFQLAEFADPAVTFVVPIDGWTFVARLFLFGVIGLEIVENQRR